MVGSGDKQSWVCNGLRATGTSSPCSKTGGSVAPIFRPGSSEPLGGRRAPGSGTSTW